jgi:hypothetical protein
MPRSPLCKRTVHRSRRTVENLVNLGWVFDSEALMSETSTKDGTAVDTLIDMLASRAICPEIQGLTVTFQLDVDDVGRRYVIVDDHDITISRGPTEADCALGCSAADFVRMTKR